VRRGLSAILHRALAEAPGAVGSSFAAADGELVEQVAATSDDLPFLTAHSAVLIAHVRAALHTFHFGDPIEIVMIARSGSILARAVADGYFALLAMTPGAPLAPAQKALGRAAALLREEIE
jgi:predicted regulator of Ras-like GTPase activity (Roadblock/LC7/MglB family)